MNKKVQEIETLIDNLNKGFLSSMNAKVAFVSKGTNNYCLTLIFRKKELCSHSFYTYADVISALNFYESIFKRAIHERAHKIVRKEQKK